jgi:DNA-binding MarR family transcriptional regulator
MTSTLPTTELPTTEVPTAELPTTEQSAESADQPADLAESADIATAVIDLVRQFSSIKSRVVSGPEADHSPMFLLVKLAKHGPSRASDLAELVCADPSTVSRQVSSLVKAGLLERRSDPDDGRASILVPTALGLERVAAYGRRRAAVMQPVIADWSNQDRIDLLRLIRKYTEGIESRREEIVSILLEHHARPEQWKESH